LVQHLGGDQDRARRPAAVGSAHERALEPALLTGIAVAIGGLPLASAIGNVGDQAPRAAARPDRAELLYDERITAVAVAGAVLVAGGLTVAARQR
jgi:hypothetical protein